MEKRILTVMNKNLQLDMLHPIKAKKDTAKEITTIFNAFILWKDKTVGLPNKNGLYLYWEEHYTIETLFQFWHTNIKNKFKL